MYNLLIHYLVIVSDRGTTLDSVRHSVLRSLSQKQGLRPQKITPSRRSRLLQATVQIVEESTSRRSKLQDREPRSDLYPTI
jgi:hypothetical protein